MQDPQIKSALTSVLLIIITNGTTWAVTKGLVSAGDAASLANALVTLTVAMMAAGLTVYKARQVAPGALIQAVNAGDNGVRVIPASVPEENAPTVNTPLK